MGRHRDWCVRRLDFGILQSQFRNLPTIFGEGRNLDKEIDDESYKKHISLIRPENFRNFAAVIKTHIWNFDSLR